MCHSCWLTPLVRLKWYFWEWFTGPAEKSGAKPFHWELLTLGSNAGGSQFQHGMDFSSFLSDKWSAYVRWEIEKNEKAAGLGGSIWKLHMQAEGTGKVLQFLLPSGVMGALGEAWSVWKRCSTKAPPCSPVWVWKHWALCAAPEGLLIPTSSLPSLGNKLLPHLHGRHSSSFELLSCVHFVHNK